MTSSANKNVNLIQLVKPGELYEQHYKSAAARITDNPYQRAQMLIARIINSNLLILANANLKRKSRSHALC